MSFNCCQFTVYNHNHNNHSNNKQMEEKERGGWDGGESRSISVYLFYTTKLRQLFLSVKKKTKKKTQQQQLKDFFSQKCNVIGSSIIHMDLVLFPKNKHKKKSKYFV